MSAEILDVVGLSPMQRGLYSVSMTSDGVDPYLVTFTLRVVDLDDVATLRRAFDGLLARYPHLGAAVFAEDVPHPVLVVTSGARIGWQEVDLRGSADPEEAAWELYWSQARQRIDLDRGPLLRAVAARLSDRSYEVVCTAHHIIIDGWSIALLMRDLVALHRGEGAALPPAPALREHAAWLAGKDTRASAHVWAQALAELEPMPMVGPPPPPGLDLPMVGEDRFGPEETAQALAWARSRGLTPNTLLQMAWARLLSGLTGRDDVVFGQTTSGRDSSLPHAESIVGALVTTIPVRVRCDERDPGQAGAHLQREVARLRAHEYLGIAEITRAARAGQLFDTLLVFENVPAGPGPAALEMGGGARLLPRRFDGPSHYPLAVVPVVENGELVCRVEVRSDLTEVFDAGRLASRFLSVVRGLTTAGRFCDVDALLGDEPAALSAPEQPDPAGAGGCRAVSDALLEAVDRAGEATAVVDVAGEQSFEAFGQAVRRLSEGLRAAGAGFGGAVAAMLPRDRRVLQAPFAIGRTGAVCVHVDPATPAERVAYMLETTGARIVLAEASHADVIARARAHGVDCAHAVPDHDGGLRFLGGPEPAGSPVPLGGSAAWAQAPFYTVFTSGTTGRPKGVVVAHGALLSHWANHERRFFAPASAKLGRQLRIGHGWSTGFDAAWQPTVALLSGHAVVLLSDEARTDAERIVAAIAEHGIDMFDTSPSMLSRLTAAGLFGAEADSPSCPLAVLALGGEAISSDTWRRLQTLPATRVVNFYGPTETTVEVLMADVHDHAAPTLGGPFDRMSAEVLDHRLRPTPPGGQGELYLSGPQLAQGYAARPAGTASAFVAGPDGGRRYRTGDLVRRATDGTIDYLGRVDDQVKINGYRVEPDEVTVVLRELEGVEQAAVLACTENGRPRLGALVVSRLSAREIRSALARRLPHFMVPTRIAHVDEIPLNRNDKLDGHAAVALLTRPQEEASSVEPATQTERMLLATVAQLGVSGKIGVGDSLADLGVDSIGAIDLVSRLRGSGYRVSARDLLAAADLRDLASRLDESGDDEEPWPSEPAAAGSSLPLTALAKEIVANGAYRSLAQTQVLELPEDATLELVVERLEALAVAHPSLRSRLDSDESGQPILVVGEASSAAELALRVEQPQDGAALLAQTVERLDPGSGRMVAATLLGGPRPRLLLSIHHLAVDVVSWLVLFDDLRRMEQGEKPYAERPAEAVPASAEPSSPRVLGAPLGARHADPAKDRASALARQVADLGPDRTERLLAACAQAGVPVEDVLLLACAEVVARSADEAGQIAVTRESHGRDPGDDTRQVGWFTVEETTLVPGALLRQWRPEAGRPAFGERSLADRGQIRLNYLGRSDVLVLGSGPWSPTPFAEFVAEFGAAGPPDTPVRFTLDVNAAVVAQDSRPSLVAHFEANTAVLGGSSEHVGLWLAALSRFAESEAKAK